MQEEDPEPSIGDIELLYAKTHKPQSTYMVVFQYAQEEVRDEVQQGGGNVLEASVADATRGEVGRDYDDDDPNNKKDSSPIDKT